MSENVEIPATSKQWIVTGTDGYDCLKYTEKPVPALGDNEVLVRSKFCNYASQSDAEQHINNEN